MIEVANVAETSSVRPSTLRVRRYRERRREHLRLLTVEIPEPVIEDAIARGLLKLEESTQAWPVTSKAFTPPSFQTKRKRQYRHPASVLKYLRRHRHSGLSTIMPMLAAANLDLQANPHPGKA
jgi:hypothetical protein